MPGGPLCVQAAAACPPTLCTNSLRGIAAQRAREGHPLPKVVRMALDVGRAVYSIADKRHAGYSVTVHKNIGMSAGELADRAALAAEAQAAQDEHPGVGQPIDDPTNEDLSVYIDGVSGETLPAGLARSARLAQAQITQIEAHVPG